MFEPNRLEVSTQDYSHTSVSSRNTHEFSIGSTAKCQSYLEPKHSPYSISQGISLGFLLQSALS